MDAALGRVELQLVAARRSLVKNLLFGVAVGAGYIAFELQTVDEVAAARSNVDGDIDAVLFFFEHSFHPRVELRAHGLPAELAGPAGEIRPRHPFPPPPPAQVGSERRHPSQSIAPRRQKRVLIG